MTLLAVTLVSGWLAAVQAQADKPFKGLTSVLDALVGRPDVDPSTCRQTDGASLIR